MTFIRKSLADIQCSRSFEGLQNFKNPSIWPSLTLEERGLLAQLLVLQGAQHLSENHEKAAENFDMALKVSLDAADVFYQQGLAYAAIADNINCLKKASQAFESAIDRNNLLLDAWIALGEVYSTLGCVKLEENYFEEANNRFLQAWHILKNGEQKIFDKELSARLMWKWGSAHYGLAKISGEPIEYQQALEKYLQAYHFGYQNGSFLTQYAHCLITAADLLNRKSYFEEALTILDLAISLENKPTFENWFYRGCCLQNLATYGDTEKWLQYANANYAALVQFFSDKPQVWIKWGELHMELGKITQDMQHLKTSLEKFSQAYLLDQNYPELLLKWAEAELALGCQEERLELINSAQSKIAQVIAIQSQNPNAWYFYGACYNELGQYFLEPHHFQSAIDKFRSGLEIAPYHSLLWYGLAIAQFELGELKQDLSSYEESAHSYEMAFAYGGEEVAQLLNDWGVCLLRQAEMTEEAFYAELAIQKIELALMQITKQATSNDMHLEWIHHYGCAFDVLGNLNDDPQHLEKAIQIFTQILSVDPTFTQARYHVALTLSHLGETTYEVDPYFQSIAHFEQLIDEYAEDEMIQLDFGITLVNLGLLIQDTHDTKQADLLYRRAEHHLMQAASLGNTQAYYQLAGLYSINQHFEQAMLYLERAYLFEALPEIEDLLHDDWLEGLRQTTSFQKFFSSIIQ